MEQRRLRSSTGEPPEHGALAAAVAVAQLEDAAVGQQRPEASNEQRSDGYTGWGFWRVSMFPKAMARIGTSLLGRSPWNHFLRLVGVELIITWIVQNYPQCQQYVWEYSLFFCGFCHLLSTNINAYYLLLCYYFQRRMGSASDGAALTHQNSLENLDYHSNYSLIAIANRKAIIATGYQPISTVLGWLWPLTNQDTTYYQPISKLVS